MDSTRRSRQRGTCAEPRSQAPLKLLPDLSGSILFGPGWLGCSCSKAKCKTYSTLSKMAVRLIRAASLIELMMSGLTVLAVPLVMVVPLVVVPVLVLGGGSAGVVCWC